MFYSAVMINKKKNNAMCKLGNNLTEIIIYAHAFIINSLINTSGRTAIID